MAKFVSYLTPDINNKLVHLIVSWHYCWCGELRVLELEKFMSFFVEIPSEFTVVLIMEFTDTVELYSY